MTYLGNGLPFFFTTLPGVVKTEENKKSTGEIAKQVSVPNGYSIDFLIQLISVLLATWKEFPNPQATRRLWQIPNPIAHWWSILSLYSRTYDFQSHQSLRNPSKVLRYVNQDLYN